MSNELASGDNDLTKISQQIENVKKVLNEKCDDLQKQIEELRSTVSAGTESQDARLIRVTSLISSTMDHIQLIVQTVVSIHKRLVECEDKTSRFGNSIIVNKRNLNSLSEYVKKVDKLWKSAREEINKLTDESEKHSKFRWGVISAISAGFAVVGHFGITWIKNVWNALFP